MKENNTHRLVRAIDRDIEVFGLGLGESGQLDVELGEMGTGDLLVELLGEDVHAKRELLRGCPERNLGQDLVGEGAGHDEGGVASGASEVDKTTLSKEDDVAAVGHGEAIDLGLNVGDRLGVGLQPGDVDFNVKVTNARLIC